MDQEKLVTSLNHYLNLLLTTSALFMAPCILIVSRDFPAHTEPYPGFFICLYLALYLTILSFFATILLGLLTMKNLDYLNLTDKKTTQNMLSNTAKIFNITRIFYRLSVYTFAMIFPSFVAVKINPLLNSPMKAFLVTYLLITPFLMTVLILMIKFSLKENVLSIKQFRHD